MEKKSLRRFRVHGIDTRTNIYATIKIVMRDGRKLYLEYEWLDAMKCELDYSILSTNSEVEKSDIEYEEE